MPRVGTKEFPYTKEGVRRARRYAEETGQTMAYGKKGGGGKGKGKSKGGKKKGRYRMVGGKSKTGTSGRARYVTKG